MERTATGVRDIHGDMIYTDDILKIKGEYTGEIFRQHGRWLVAVETLRFMFPMTILPLTTAFSEQSEWVSRLLRLLLSALFFLYLS